MVSKWLLVIAVTWQWVIWVGATEVPPESSTSPVSHHDGNNEWEKQLNRVLVVQGQQQRELETLKDAFARQQNPHSAVTPPGVIERLNAQVTALRATLEEVWRQREHESAYAANYAGDISAMRNEIKALRAEEEQQQDSTLESITGRENAHKTLHWLQEAVKELRTDIQDLNRVVNAQRNQTQGIEHQFEELKLSYDVPLSDSPSKDEDEITHLHARVDQIAQTQQSLTTAFAELADKVGMLQLQMEARDTPIPAKKVPRLGAHSVRSRGRRHRHGAEENHLFLEDNVTGLLLRFQGLERQFFAISSNVSHLNSIWRGTAPRLSRLEEEMAGVSMQVKKCENLTVTENRLYQLQYHNVSRMLETWQAEYETDLGRFQTQVDKLQLNMTEAVAQLGLLRDSQVDNKETLHKIRDLANRIERHHESDQIKLSVLETHLLNSTLQKSRDLIDEIDQTSKNMELEQRILVLETSIKLQAVTPSSFSVPVPQIQAFYLPTIRQQKELPVPASQESD